MTFPFVDLFAGVGGFHAVLSALGGHAVVAAEIDPWAAKVYEDNWGLRPERDVVDLASRAHQIPAHSILAGGFPCQPFSKGGHQRGMSEVRGQMVNEILKILEVHKPPVIFLENVRNLAGPRQRPVWEAVVQGVREAGYRVPSEPATFSPHLLPPQLGGSPQIRERIYILGTYVGRNRALEEVDLPPILSSKPVDGWNPKDWNLQRDVLEYGQLDDGQIYLQAEELEWIDTWNDFLRTVTPAKLPSFPMWSSYWNAHASVDRDAPTWKQALELKNITFYQENRTAIHKWLRRNPQLRQFPASRQKLEWQAGNSAKRDLYSCLLHFRPSGIRAKLPDYSPALVAMAQTPVYGPWQRRLTARESARLQGFPEWFDFGRQPDRKSYKQMGNAIHVGAAYYALRRHVVRDATDISATLGGSELVAAVTSSSQIPILEKPHSHDAVAVQGHFLAAAHKTPHAAKLLTM